MWGRIEPARKRRKSGDCSCDPDLIYAYLVYVGLPYDDRGLQSAVRKLGNLNPEPPHYICTPPGLVPKVLSLSLLLSGLGFSTAGPLLKPVLRGFASADGGVDMPTKPESR